MNIGILAVDSNFPNLALMKISAYHKARGDQVEWYNPLCEYDKVYTAKVFRNGISGECDSPQGTVNCRRSAYAMFLRAWAEENPGTQELFLYNQEQIVLRK